jgi:hypothetical protein
MKNAWLPLAAALILASCSPDHTLESLIPKNSLAVVLIDHPNLAAAVLGPSSGDLPWKQLNTDKPWAAAAVPANPPGFLIAVSLADEAAAWPAVQTWAKDRGGLEAVKLGAYAVLTSPGLAAPTLLDADQRFDLDRVRKGNDPVAVYVDVKNLLASSAVPSGWRSASPLVPWAAQNLAGLRIGLAAREGGLSLRLATDWISGSVPASFLKALGPPADLALWTSRISAPQSLGAAFSVSEAARTAPSFWPGDPALTRRWAALAPLVGPRGAVSVSPRADGTWAWAAAFESPDPQAVRQAIKTLVASGDVQRHFPEWALDADTPLIYQDKPDAAGGVRTQLTLGTTVVHVSYGSDRVALAGGAGAQESAAVWKRPAEAPAPWFREAPADASVVAAGAMDGLGARGAVRVLGDGNVELRLWVDAAGLKAWEERLPQAAMSWLSGPGGWTRAEP